MKLILSVILSGLIVTASFAQNAKEQAVWARVEALNKAIFETKDSTALSDLVSSKLIYGHSGGNLEDKVKMVHNAVVSPTTYRNPTTEKVSVFFVNETAIVRQVFRATSVENGTETPLNLGILQVWALENAKWRIVARQAVKIAPKQ